MVLPNWIRRDAEMFAVRKVRVLACFALLCNVLVAASGAPERQIAEWVIRQGGRVMVDGQRQVIDELAELPAAPFRLTAVDLVGTTIAPADLARLAGLDSLKELSLPGPIFTPFSDSPLEANAALKPLAGLAHLERLFFSLHFLPTYNVDDRGVAYLAALTRLRELRLSQSRIRTPNLAPFAHLESLDLSDCPYFGDGGMATLQGLKDLRRLYLRNTPLSDEGLKYLSGLTALQDLDLYGTAVTDRGIESLRSLVALRKLNLLGAEVTDAGAGILAGLPRLRELNLYRSHVSNTGLAKLAGLKDLASLDIRYSRVTEAGVDALKAALPECSVEFAGGAVAGSGKGPALLPAGTSDRAIGAWVRRLGGKVEFRGDALVAISLASTPVTDAQLSHLSGLTGLVRLDLDATQIGDLGLRSLNALAGLQTLSLNNTTVSDAGLASLGSLRELRSLRLCGATTEDFLINMTSRCYLHREGWLKRYMEARTKYGPGLYGASASHEGGTPHICTRAYALDASLIRDYPHLIDTRAKGQKFECGEWCLTSWIKSRKLPTMQVTWDSEQDEAHWRDPKEQGIYRRNNQSAMLVWDRHSDLYRDASAEEKIRLEKMADPNP